MDERTFAQRFGFGLDAVARTADRLRQPMRRGYFTFNLNVTNEDRKRQIRKVLEGCFEYLQTQAGRDRVYQLSLIPDYHLDGVPGYEARMERQQRAQNEAARHYETLVAATELRRAREAVSSAPSATRPQLTRSSATFLQACSSQAVYPPPAQPGSSSSASTSGSSAGETMTLEYESADRHPLFMLTQQNPSARNQDPTPLDLSSQQDPPLEVLYFQTSPEQMEESNPQPGSPEFMEFNEGLDRKHFSRTTAALRRLLKKRKRTPKELLDLVTDEPGPSSALASAIQKRRRSGPDEDNMDQGPSTSAGLSSGQLL